MRRLPLLFCLSLSLAATSCGVETHSPPGDPVPPCPKEAPWPSCLCVKTNTTSCLCERPPPAPAGSLCWRPL